MDLNNSLSRTIKIIALALGGLYAAALPAQQITTLMQAYELAKESDPEYQSAIAIHLAAQESIPQARAGLLPSLSADLNTSGNRTKVRQVGLAGGFSGRRGTTDFNTTDFNIQFSQPLYRKDRWIALDQAKKIVNQADTVFAFAEQSLMLRLADRYFGVLGAADTLTFTIAAQDAFGQQLEQSQQRFQVGLVAITDVEEAKAGFDLARAEVINAENLLDNAREALREVTGNYAEIVARLGESMPLEMPTPNNIDTWTQTALQQNLELRGQLEQADRARLEIQRIEAGHLPTLDLVGRYGLSRSNGGLSNGTNQDSTRIGLELQIPIYQGGLIVSRTRQSRSLYQRELDEQERIRRSVQRQTRDSFLGIQSGISRVQALEQAVVSTQAAVEAIEAGFQVGTRTTVDVLQAQRNLFQSKRDYSLALYAYVLDILRLKIAAGILSEEDLRLINSWLL